MATPISSSQPRLQPHPLYYNSHAYNHTLANNHGRITLNEFKNTQHTKGNKFLKKRQTYLCTIHLPLKSRLITIKPHVALRDSPAFTKQTQTDSKATSGSTQHSATKILLKESDSTKPTLKGEHPAFQMLLFRILSNLEQNEMSEMNGLAIKEEFTQK